jgi:hypothetical protein
MKPKIYVVRHKEKEKPRESNTVNNKKKKKSCEAKKLNTFSSIKIKVFFFKYFIVMCTFGFGIVMHFFLNIWFITVTQGMLIKKNCEVAAA